VPGELEHVVGAAALLGGGAQLPGQDPGVGAPALPVAGAARAVGAVQGDLLPEELHQAAIALLAGQLVAAGRPHHLGELGVGVLALQLVASLGEGIEDAGLIEAMRQIGVIPVARQSVDVVEELVHAPELDLEDARHLVVAEPVGPLPCPGDHAQEDVQGLLVATVLVHVEHARHDLVQGVEGRPDRQPLLQPLHELRGEGRQPAGSVGPLALSQLRHDGGGLRLQQLIAGAAVGQAARGQVMAREMAAQLDVRPLPTAELPGRRGKPRGQPEGMEQAVGIERVQVHAVAILKRVTGSAQQAHLLQRKRASLDGPRLPCRSSALRFETLAGARAGGQRRGGEQGSELSPADSLFPVHRRCSARSRPGRDADGSGSRHPLQNFSEHAHPRPSRPPCSRRVRAQSGLRLLQSPHGPGPRYS
jgi:hypothetical protein